SVFAEPVFRLGSLALVAARRDQPARMYARDEVRRAWHSSRRMIVANDPIEIARDAAAVNRIRRPPHELLRVHQVPFQDLRARQLSAEVVDGGRAIGANED